MGVRVSMQPRAQVQIPEQTVLVARAVFPNGSVAMSARDRLGEVFTDEQFSAAFGAPGRSGRGLRGCWRW